MALKKYTVLINQEDDHGKICATHIIHIKSEAFPGTQRFTRRMFELALMEIYEDNLSLIGEEKEFVSLPINTKISRAREALFDNCSLAAVFDDHIDDLAGEAI